MYAMYQNALLGADDERPAPFFSHLNAAMTSGWALIIMKRLH